MTTPDVHALTGAYVLDAVPELERAAFERHLAECDACTQEVRELRETAARLGSAAAAEPPPYLKSQVMGRIAQVRQLPPDPSANLNEPIAGRPRWALRLTTAAAAVFLVVSAVLGVLLVQATHSEDQGRALASALVGASDATVVSGQGGGGSATMVVSRSTGRALVLANLPGLPSDKVYQAWLINGDNAQSAGLLTGRVLDVSGLGDAKSIGVTVENAGGADKPSMPPIVNLPV
jgi:anti-sigma factor RsiW